MSYSLLAHLYPHIRGSQEDIATLSLQYLISQSIELNRTYTSLMSEVLKLPLLESMQYVCQVTGDSDEKERPDMVGLNSNGDEVLLCEMKFYATLTPNQPLKYLDRLKKNGGLGLVFVSPTARRTSLWTKLLELCNEHTIEHVSDWCVSVDGVRMGILTWNEIIAMLTKTASAVAIQYTSDIAQLEGYCNQLDSEAFIPFSADDLSAEAAKKAERYYQVLDDVIDLLEADKTLKTSKKGTKATAYRRGYTRSLAINDYTITLNYDRELWKNPRSLETPFWVAIRDSDWHQTPDICESLAKVPELRKEHFWNMIFLSLEPQQNATLSEVAEDLKKQILHYFELLH